MASTSIGSRNIGLDTGATANIDTGITDDVGVSYPMGPGVTGNVEVSNQMGHIEAAIEVAIHSKAEAVVKMRMSQMSMVNPS